MSTLEKYPKCSSHVSDQKGFVDKRVFEIPPSRDMWQIEKDLLENVYSTNCTHLYAADAADNTSCVGVGGARSSKKNTLGGGNEHARKVS